MASAGTSARPRAHLVARVALVTASLAVAAVGAFVHHPSTPTLAAAHSAAPVAHVAHGKPAHLAALPVASGPSVPVTGAPPAPTAPPAPPSPTYRSFLIGDDGLHTPVTEYTDCNGATPLTHTSAAIDTCVTDHLYFVGHNPGVFTPLMKMGVGSLITYWDGDGVPHTVRVIAVEVWSRPADMPAPTPGATMEFQTCANATGSILRNLEAVPA